MQLKLFNTLSGKKEVFNPLDQNCVRIYMCGPTVYDYAHIGNARAFVAFDLLYRVLKLQYSNVLYVRNITDVDDKILAAMQHSGESFEALTSRMVESFHEDMDKINLVRPDKEPRATEHIPEMLEIIKTLIAKGHAYENHGHVLFSVASWPSYGCLSRLDREELIAGARIEVAPYKHDPADFVLWKPAQAGEIGWSSPWGFGRPGWHIECSAMSSTYLGTVFDLHGGGQDLIFPHHENEIAQSSACFNGRPHARYWFHNGFLTINGTKMSKSLGNFYTVHQLLREGYEGESIRLALMTAHYRQPLDFSIDLIRRANAMLDRWYSALQEHGTIDDSFGTKLSQNVLEAVSNDLNFPAALAELNLLASNIFKEEDDKRRDAMKLELRSTAMAMGLMGKNVNEWFRGLESPNDISAEEIEKLIAERARLRKNKQYIEADDIRARLASRGIAIDDTPEGVRWRRDHL